MVKSFPQQDIILNARVLVFFFFPGSYIYGKIREKQYIDNLKGLKCCILLHGTPGMIKLFKV